MNIVIRNHNRFRNYLVIPIYVKLVLLLSTIKCFFLGFEIVNSKLGRLSKPCVIPFLKKYGALIGNNCDIETGLTIHNCRNYANLCIGDNVHIGKNCFFDLKDKIFIDSNVIISMQSTLITHIDLTNSELSLIYPEKNGCIQIKKNCYLGANSTVLMGVTIHENSFIAANSLVIRNVASNSMIGGVPAKKIKDI